MCSTTSSNENPTKTKIVHLDELWNFGIQHFSVWHHQLFRIFDSSFELLHFLLNIVSTYWHEMQWTTWGSFLFHKIIGKKISHLDIISGFYTSLMLWLQIKGSNYVGPWKTQEHIATWSPTGGPRSRAPTGGASTPGRWQVGHTTLVPVPRNPHAEAPENPPPLHAPPSPSAITTAAGEPSRSRSWPTIAWEVIRRTQSHLPRRLFGCSGPTSPAATSPPPPRA